MVNGRAFASAVKLSNGNVLITGGYTGTNRTNVTSSAELYSPSQNGFASASDPSYPASMQTARAEHSSVLLTNNDVLNVGGFKNSTGTRTANVDFYNSTASSNTPTNTLSVARAQQTATLLSASNTVLVIGGSGTSGDTSTEICTFASGNCTWSAGGAMIENKSLHSAVRLSGGPNANGVLVCGGLKDNSAASISSKCALSNSAGSSFSTVTSLGVATYALAGVEIPGDAGKVLFCGGYTDVQGDLSSSCAVEDTTGSANASSLVVTQPLIRPRAAFGLIAPIVVSTINSAFAGGGDSGSGTASVETYDPQ
jgi:hypothetical protein